MTNGPDFVPSMEFLNTLSRELRIPLSQMFSSVPLVFSRLKIRMEIDQPLRAYLTEMYYNCHRILRSVINTQEICALESGSVCFEPREADIVSYLRETSLMLVQYLSPIGMEVSFQTQLARRILAFDQSMITNIMIHLASNAARYASEGGRLSITLRGSTNGVVVVVEDCGRGMSEEALSRLFSNYDDPRGSVRAGHGTGLGLAIVRKTAELHGGTVIVNSIKGRGLSVTVSLKDLAEGSPMLHASKFDYSGGLDPYLVGLADVLPSEFYTPV